MGQRKNKGKMVKMELDLRLLHKMDIMKSLLVLNSGSELLVANVKSET